MCETRTKLCRVLTEEVEEKFQEQETVSELAGQGKIKLDANMAKCLNGMAGEVTERRLYYFP